MPALPCALPGYFPAISKESLHAPMGGVIPNFRRMSKTIIMGMALTQFGTHSVSAQETPPPPVAAVQAVASTEEQVLAPENTDANEQVSLSVDPIGSDDAGLDASGAAEAAVASMEDLDKGGVPQAFLFRIAVGGTYSDNLYLTEFSAENDIALVELAGVTYRSPEGKKSAVMVNYDVTGSQYLDHPELDGLNQSVSLNGLLTLPKTTLLLNAKYDYLSNVAQGQLTSSQDQSQIQSSYANQVATQFTERQTASASLTASRELATKTVLNATLAYSGSYYDDERFQSSRNFYSQLGLSYRITGKTTLGLAGAFGFLDTDGVPGQTYQSALLTANYDATGKLIFAAQAGPQLNQYASENGTDYPDSTQFVFNLQSTYKIRPKTTLQLNAYSNNNGSASVAGASLATTQIRLTLSQNLGQRFVLEFAGAFENNGYEQGLADSATKREDQFWNSAVRLNFQPSKKFSLGCFYNYLTNESNTLGASYEGSRFGVQAAVSF